MAIQFIPEAIKNRQGVQRAAQAGSKIKKTMLAIFVGFHKYGRGGKQLSLFLRIATYVESPIHLTGVGAQASDLAATSGHIEAGAGAAMWAARQHHRGDYRAAQRLLPNEFAVFFVQAVAITVARAKVDMMMIDCRLTMHGVRQVMTCRISPYQITGLDAHAQERPGRIIITIDEITVAQSKQDALSAHPGRRGETR